MLAAIQLLPVLNYSQFSHRRNSPTAEGYAGYVASSIQPFELASLSQATANGNPRRWANGEPQTGVSSYWPAFVKQGANYAESAVALGPWVLGLLLLVPWRRRETWVLASIGGLAFLLAIGTPLNALLYFGVPGWSSTGSPGRIAVLFVLVASVLAPLGLTELRRREATAAGPPPVALVGIGLVVLLAVARVLGSLATFPEGPVGDSIRGIAAANASSVALLDLVGIVVVIGTVLGIAKLPKAASAAILALPVVLAILADVPNLVMTGEPLPKVTGTNLARIAVVNEGWGLTAAAPALLPPNTAAQSRIRELGGYDSLLHRETVELLNDINGRDSAPPANGNMMFIKPGFNVAKLTEAGVQEVWSKELLPIALTKAPKTEDGIIKTWIGGPGLASLSRGTATIVRDELGQIDLKVQGSGRLTVRERAMPGWEARIDNQKLEVPPGRWIELDLPAGTTNVRLRYTPPGLRNGMLATFAGLLVLVGLLVAGRRKA
jgi:hypothetical protein